MTKTITVDELKKQWQTTMPDSGVTRRKKILDNQYSLEWSCLYNFKRMQRRLLPKERSSSCAFCSAFHSNKFLLGTTSNFKIFGNKYPIEPLHFLLFNALHKEDPTLPELKSMTKLAWDNSELKVLLSNRKGSGASIPNHLHVHAFSMNLPIEQASIKYIIKINSVEIRKLLYPAWSLNIYCHDSNKLSYITHNIIDNFRLPFNVTFTKHNVFIIPRRVESPRICENLVDGVGSLETAGVYTLVNEKALDNVNKETFQIGLTECGFGSDHRFQERFFNYCMELIRKL